MPKVASGEWREKKGSGDAVPYKCELTTATDLPQKPKADPSPVTKIRNDNTAQARMPVPRLLRGFGMTPRGSGEWRVTSKDGDALLRQDVTGALRPLG